VFTGRVGKATNLQLRRILHTLSIVQPYLYRGCLDLVIMMEVCTSVCFYLGVYIDFRLGHPLPHNEESFVWGPTSACQGTAGSAPPRHPTSQMGVYHTDLIRIHEHTTDGRCGRYDKR
jgi:hypothetical protein